jgi:hypothetical protein
VGKKAARKKKGPSTSTKNGSVTDIGSIKPVSGKLSSMAVKAAMVKARPFLLKHVDMMGTPDVVLDIRSAVMLSGGTNGMILQGVRGTSDGEQPGNLCLSISRGGYTACRMVFMNSQCTGFHGKLMLLLLWLVESSGTAA